MSDFRPPPWRLKFKNWRPNGLETWQMDRRTQDGRHYSWAIDSDQLYALADCVQDAIEEYESRTVTKKRNTV